MFPKLKDKIFKKLSNVEIIEVKVGDMKSSGIITLKKLSEYKDKMYNISWTDKQLIMREKIKNGNYDNDSKEMPVISKNGVILDGYHRLTTLNYYQGPDFIVKVEKTPYSYFMYGFYFFLFYFLQKND